MAAQVALCICMILLAPLCLARYTSTVPDNAGSGDYSDGTHTTSASVNVWATSPTEEEEKNSSNGTTTGKSLLDGIMHFFKEYMLLMVVVGSLVFMMIFIVCAAVIVRQKHKAAAYYPSSFPKKKYVDENDKSGGAQAFSEVPAKAPDSKAEEPVDCSRKLQEDILAATHNLKSPSKVVANGETANTEEQPKENEANIKNEEAKGKSDISNGQAGNKIPETAEPVKEAPSGAAEALPPSDKDGEASAHVGDQPAEEVVKAAPETNGDSNVAKDTSVEATLNECSGAPAAGTKTSKVTLEV